MNYTRVTGVELSWYETIQLARWGLNKMDIADDIFKWFISWNDS